MSRRLSSVGTKIGVGFAVILAMFIALDFYVSGQIGKAVGWTNELHDRPLQVSNVSADVRAGLNKIQLLSAFAILGVGHVGSGEFDALKADILKSLKVVDGLYDGDRSRVQSIQADITKAFQISSDMLQQLKGGLREQAMATYVNSLIPVADHGRDLAVYIHNDSLHRIADEFVTRVNQSSAATSTIILISSLAAVLIGIVLAALSILSVTRPTRRLRDVVLALAAGKLDVVVPDTHKHSEIGAMAKGVSALQDSLKAAEQFRALQKEQAASTEAEKRGSMQSLAAGFERQVGAVVATVLKSATDLQTSAKGMSSVAQATNERAVTVASSSKQAIASVHIVAAAVKEMSGSMSTIALQANSAAQVAGEAMAEAEQTNDLVEGLSAAAKKIGDIVVLITNIASQTNLLALNATIEAARAGDAGKGFAVVASEVKGLAAQTTTATAEIATQVAQIQQATGLSVLGIRSIGGVISRINETITIISRSIEQQNAATGEIAISLHQAAEGTQQISSNIAKVAIAAQDSGKMASTVLTAAELLSDESSQLQREVVSFVKLVRTA